MLEDFLSDCEVVHRPPAARRTFRWFAAVSHEQVASTAPSDLDDARLLFVCRLGMAGTLLRDRPRAFALALADAFECSVNELPLTLVLSWYEQKAVCILLTLLALGVKNIYLGPTLPAFLSETVVKALVDAYGLRPITAPEQDLDAILGRG